MFAALLALQLASQPPLPASVLADLLDAPPAHDRYRFPDAAVASHAVAFNDAFRENLAQERRIWPHSMQLAFVVTVDEAMALREIWWRLSLSQADEREWSHRLHLKRLRYLLGPEDYAGGRMPPAVPAWRFRDKK